MRSYIPSKFRHRKETKQVESYITVNSRFEKVKFNEDGTNDKVQEDATDSRETIDVLTFPENVEPARVTCSRDYKINVGNYESVGIFCSVSLPCYVEETDKALKKCWDICEDQVVVQAKKVKDKAKQRADKRSKGE